MDKLKIVHLENDIKEIDEILSAMWFDRRKAEETIRKHNLTDAKVAVFNSPLNPNVVRLDKLTDEQVANNLLSIRVILCGELAEELAKEEK